MTTLYSAIMQAAHYLEGHPEEFNIGATRVPAPNCDSPGCALGWISSFCGVSARSYGYFEGIAREMGLLNDLEFYARMALLEGLPLPARGTGWDGYGRWTKDASECARVLRLYAEKYHGHEKPASPPDWNALAGKWTVGDDVRSQELA